jgi:PEP-CTERM motif
MNLIKIGAVLAAAALYAGGAQASELIHNGSFETGDFTGWTLGGNVDGFTVVASSGFDGLNAPDGNYYAALGAIGSDNILSQTFADVAGALYEASFYLASDGDTPNDFAVVGPGPLSLGPLTDIAASPFVQYFGFFTGSGSDTITFYSRNDPGYLGLDLVSVQGPGVPEPAAWSMMLLGFGGLGAVMRRRRNAVALAA